MKSLLSGWAARQLAGLMLLTGLSAAFVPPRAEEDASAKKAAWTPDDPDLARDLAQLQGRWQRTGRNAEGQITSRQEKLIDGNSETVTYYGGAGEALRKHTVKFRLEKHGPIRIFSVYEQTTYEGGQAVTSEVDFSYVYRVEDEQLLDAPGLFTTRRSYQSTPVVYKWERVSSPDAQAKPN